MTIVVCLKESGRATVVEWRYDGFMTQTRQIIEGPTPRPLKVAVVTVSDTRTVETDKSGEALLEFLQGAGHSIVRRTIVKDDEDAIRSEVRSCCETEDVEVVLVTGGTGITRRDVTPEAIRPLVTKEIPGFGELFRSLSYQDIGAATIQSRAFAALCTSTLVFAMPGSTGAVKLAVDKILRSQLDIRSRPCNFVELLPRLSE